MEKLRKSEVLNAIPTSWLDNLLTGPKKVIGDGPTYSAREIEKVLQGVRARIVALPTVEK